MLPLAQGYATEEACYATDSTQRTGDVGEGQLLARWAEAARRLVRSALCGAVQRVGHLLAHTCALSISLSLARKSRRFAT
jgi:hypothetical protein